MSGSREVCPEYHSAYILYRISREKKLMRSKTSLTTPGFSFVKLIEGTKRRLHKSCQRALFSLELSLLILSFPIRANFDSKLASCPIL